MKVNLISLTQSLMMEGTPIEDLTPEKLIVYIARVSNPGNQMNTETSDRLIDYLIRNKHWSPFEMVDMTVEIYTSRAIAAQILRHRSFSFQEFSQRYAKVTDMEEVNIRIQGMTNRQSSSEEFDPLIRVDLGNDIQAVNASIAVQEVIDHAQAVYKAMIEASVAKETARMILPLTTQTRIYMKGSIRSWIHYFAVRCDGHTQLEHRLVAESIQDIFIQNFPMISKALNYGEAQKAN